VIPVLLGMNNSLSRPYQEGSAGWRIWKMLHERTGASREEYCRAFERRNLIISELCPRATMGVITSLSGREVLAFGSAIGEVLGLPDVIIEPFDFQSIRWRRLPHPSGRCRWYDERECRAIAGMVLEDLYCRSEEYAKHAKVLRYSG
jgi:hypothetical protein